MDALGATSKWIAAARAIESLRSDRLFYDPYAADLAGASGARLFEDLDKAGGHSAFLAIRTRFFDDFALAGTSSLRQIVLLAAGMDVRAFRLPWPSGTTLYELDQPDVLAHKEAILRERGASTSCARRVVGTDLAGRWTRDLVAAGFDRRAPAVFLVEGLTAYLSAPAVEAMLADLRRIAAPASMLGLDFVGQSFLDSATTTTFLARLADHGCRWSFGTDNPGALLARLGWNATVTVPGAPEANWGRWPSTPTERQGDRSPRSYLVRAVPASRRSSRD